MQPQHNGPGLKKKTISSLSDAEGLRVDIDWIGSTAGNGHITSKPR
jgi:hypothetical protein